MSGHVPTSDIEALLKQCLSGDRDVRYAAVVALQEHGDTRSEVGAALLALACDDEESDIREAAIRALGELGRNDVATRGFVVPVLVARLSEADMLIRNQLVESLGIIGSRLARPALERILGQDPDWVVRASAAEALGHVGDADALDALHVAAREDPYYPVRTYAVGSIARLGGPETLSFLRERLADEEHPQTRNELVEHALAFGDRDVFDGLLALLRTDDWDMAMHPVDSVARFLDRPPHVLLERHRELADALEALAERVRHGPHGQATADHVTGLAARVRALSDAGTDDP